MGNIKRNSNIKLNIAMLGHKRIPSREGGIEIVVEELATRMAARGHSVTVYNRMGHHICGAQYDPPKSTTYKGVRIKNVLTINRRGFSAMTSSLTAAVCAAFGKYDVVHFHAEGPCAMIWLPKMFGKQCIVTIHGLDHRRAKWGKLASAYIMFGEKCAVKYADEIIVLSESAGKYFSETYGRRTKYIPNGVNHPQISEANIIKKNFDLRKDDYFLFVGRLVPEKGLKYLIEAFKNTNTAKKLVIAGGVSDTDSFETELREMAKDDARIIFTGFVQGEMLVELYNNAYVYVLPSDLEGMPLTLLEAMSYGNCCLVSNIEECTSVIGDKGLIFPKSNIKELKNKLQFTCDNETIVQQYKKEAKDFICEKYNWDDIVTQTLALYIDKSHDKYDTKQVSTHRRIRAPRRTI